MGRNPADALLLPKPTSTLCSAIELQYSCYITEAQAIAGQLYQENGAQKTSQYAPCIFKVEFHPKNTTLHQ